tara:strand:- start:88 stop:1611 length:1524 start_codon:yes stop_codon:yes gene_type:complete
MINNLKKILNKYSFLKNSFLKDLRIRKQNVKSIWNKSDTPVKEKSIKNSNLVKFASFLSEIDLTKYSLFKKFKVISSKNTFNKKVKSLAKAKSQKILKKLDKKSFRSNLLQRYKISAEVYSNYFKSKLSKIDFNRIERLLDQHLSVKITNFIKAFHKNNFNNKNSKKTKLVNFLGIYYANNKLTITHLQRKNNSNIIKDFVQITAPGDLIGEYKIEKVSEVNRIINDVINIFELNNPPIILFLSSSFFTTRSFNDRELVIFSEEDPLLLSKSPFLPDETLIQYKRVNGDKNTSYHRVIYANKDVIDSWMNVISLSGWNIATVTCPAIHTIEKITTISTNAISVLCDIEDFITTIYVIRRNCELFSSRLPFGSSFYITGQESLNDQFFSRLEKSVKLIISDSKLKFDDNIYLIGNGLDKMLSKNKIISDGFLKAPRNKFKFEKQKESNFLHESILSSFSDALDILIKEDDSKIKQIDKGQNDGEIEANKKFNNKNKNSLTSRRNNYKG